MYFGNVLSSGNAYQNQLGNLIKIPENATNVYIYTTNNAFNNNFVCFFDENKISLGYKQGNSNTITTGAKYLTVRIGKNDGVSGTSYSTKIMVSFSQISDYIKHEEQNYQISLGTENLLQNNLTSGTENGITYVVNADKSVTLNGTATAITWLILNRSVTLEAGTYTMSSSYSGNDVRIYSTGLGVYTLDGQRTKTKTTSVSGDVSINIASGTTCNNLTIKPMIQKGSKATSYSPYGIIPIKLNSSPDGTIRDAIIGTPDNWVKREYIGKVVLNGSETIQYTSANNRFDFSVSNCKPGSSGKPNVISNNYTGKYSFDNYSIFSTSYGNQIAIIDNRFTNVNDFKTWLSTHNTIVYFQKTEYTDIPITDTTLINQLNDIYNNAHSYNGTTNITTTYEDGNEQMYLDIEVLKNVWDTSL